MLAFALAMSAAFLAGVGLGAYLTHPAFSAPPQVRRDQLRVEVV